MQGQANRDGLRDAVDDHADSEVSGLFVGGTVHYFAVPRGAWRDFGGFERLSRMLYVTPALKQSGYTEVDETADADTQSSWACSGLVVGDSNEIDGDSRDDCACAESHQATDNYWALE